jgi:alginate O-acetyltransferase complex protein AlgI
VAGPIIRYHEIASQFVTRKVNSDCMAQGMRRFIYGLSKKVLVANPVGAIADRAFAVPLSQVGADTAWLAALCYALQIYFDFSGYSDMAIGLGRMFGFTFPENFNFPYIATSIRDFCRRW